MKRRDYRDYIRDIIDSISDIESFTANMRYDSFEKDKKTIYAVVRCIEILGEAARKIPDSIRSEYPDIPWEKMVGMRNKMIHEYFGVDTNILWETIIQDIPAIKPLIGKLAEGLD